VQRAGVCAGDGIRTDDDGDAASSGVDVDIDSDLDFDADPDLEAALHSDLGTNRGPDLGSDPGPDGDADVDSHVDLAETAALGHAAVAAGHRSFRHPAAHAVSSVLLSTLREPWSKRS
jgi:hypothetical protein